MLFFPIYSPHRDIWTQKPLRAPATIISPRDNNRNPLKKCAWISSPGYSYYNFLHQKHQIGYRTHTEKEGRYTSNKEQPPPRKQPFWVVFDFRCC
mmetsp:Transcript_36185/g.39990  ORF Transcript_36185/g.39990 Transcript_36185/m.39990 type:complete len:95 (-) Transcript_36185:738-1022(-)